MVLSGVLLTQGNLNGIFGPPPTKIGEHLYSGFTPTDITEISLVSNDARATFSRASGSWMMTSPVKDRMDPRWAKTLIDFTLSTRAADVIPNEKIDATQAGLTDGMVSIRLGDANGKSRAKYTLGRRTAWIGKDPDTGEEVPTVFMQPRDRSRKTYTYACTGDIRPIFKDGLRYFRDHQPFLFAPSQLEKIQVKSANAEFVLEGKGQRSPWRITKPQKLATETTAIKTLIEGLFSLRAYKVLDLAEITLPSATDTIYLQISLQSSGQNEPVTLSVYPPADDKAATVYATVSDRPGTVFELPLRPAADLISLSELPLTNVNDLRSQNIFAFNHQKLSAIVISPDQAPNILLSRPANRPWQMHLDETTTAPLNEITLYQFLKTLTEAKVAGFITDSAFLTDDPKELSLYGLDKPLLTIQFAFQDNSRLSLKIGKNKEGALTGYLDHPDTKNTVVKLPDDFINQLPLRLNQWRDTRLLAIAAVDFAALERMLVNSPSMNLAYDYINEKWKSSLNGEDTSGKLNIARANKLLNLLGDLHVKSWLDADDKQAMESLTKPLLTMNIVSRTVDKFGEQGPLVPRTLEITPVSTEGKSEFFYGRLTGADGLFLLDRKTALLLALDLFSESE